MKKQKIIDVSGAELRPKEPKKCEGAKKWKKYGCCCDECNYFLLCFPQFDSGIKKVGE